MKLELKAETANPQPGWGIEAAAASQLLQNKQADGRPGGRAEAFRMLHEQNTGSLSESPDAAPSGQQNKFKRIQMMSSASLVSMDSNWKSTPRTLSHTPGAWESAGCQEGCGPKRKSQGPGQHSGQNESKTAMTESMYGAQSRQQEEGHA